MSLEQAILDRLEKRNAQIAQLQSTIQALERAADAEREHARQQLGPLIEENKKLSARIDDSEVIERRERVIKSLNEEITKRDKELREMDTTAKAHREGLQAKENEIQEWLAQLERARQERDAALLEVAQLRAEVPLESTREALKNATAKIAELKNDVRRCYEMADEIGRGEGESIAELIARQAERISALMAKLKEVTNERDKAQRQVMTDWAFISKCYECAKKHGIKDGEYFDQFIMRIASTLQEVTTERDQAEADAKTAQADAQRLGDECARLAGKVAELEAQKTQAERMERGIEVYSSLANSRAQEIEALRQDVARERDRGNRINAEYEADMKKIMAAANELGRADYEAPDAFMKRQAARLAALESQAKCERDKLKARLEPLENMYETVKGIRLEMQIIGKYKQVQAAVDEAMKALSQLTA